MANNLTSNPLRCDTAATVIDATTSPEGEFVNSMQWVDDTGAAGGVIANADDLSMTVNGVTIGLVCTLAASAAGAIIWSVTFPQPMRVYSLVVATIEGGTLLVWKA